MIVDTNTKQSRHHQQQGAPIDTSHLAGCSDENEITMAPDALLQKALSVFGPILGEGHPETHACQA